MFNPHVTANGVGTRKRFIWKTFKEI